MASYTVLFAADGPAALSALDTALFANRVVLLGRLGAPREDDLGILDVVDPEEVRARLAAAGLDVTGIEVARWYATPALREFARTRRQRCRLVAAALSRPGSRSVQDGALAATSGGRRSNSNPCPRRPRRPVR